MNRLAKKEIAHTTRQQGAMLIFFLFMLPVLIATMGLALDVGKFFIVKSELQNAADACALAAAYELDGTPTQFTRANAAGLNLAAKNNVYFQQGAVAGTTVKFSTTATGGFANPAPANASFVRCNVNQPNVPTWFIQMVGIGNQTIPATAVASNVPGQTTCALPVGLCNAPPSTPVGTWLEGVQSAAGGNTGFFRWIDFDPPAGGANELKALLSGANTCSINSTNPSLPIAGYGVVSGADEHYNTRFGIRAGGTPNNSVPDYSGYAYFPTNWPTKFNAYSDFVASRRPVNAAYQGVGGITINGNPTILNSTQLAEQGSNRRVAVAPVIDCATQTFQRWACVFLLHPMSTSGPPSTRMYLEYLGDAKSTGPCKSFEFAGPGGGAGPKVSALVQ